MNGSPPSGWYPDPNGPPGQERWWDSSQGSWGEFTREQATNARRQSIDAWPLVAAISCAAMLIGPFAPWATALGGVLSRSGLDLAGEDAWVMLALSVGCTFLVFQWITTAGTHDLTLLLTALPVVGIAVFHIVDIENNHPGLGVGWGLYLSAAGAAAVALAAFLGLVNSR